MSHSRKDEKNMIKNICHLLLLIIKDEQKLSKTLCQQFTEAPVEACSLTIFSDVLDLLDDARERMHRGGKLFVSCIFHAVCNGFCVQQLSELFRSILHVLREWHLAAIAESSQHAIVEQEAGTAGTCCQIRVCVCACARARDKACQ
jgi:hypothetical protein